MTFTNADILEKISILEHFLDRSDIVGYAAARNTRKLRNEIVEYEKFRNNLIKEYGTPEVDENGNETGRFMVMPNSKDFVMVSAKMDELDKIEHNVDIMTIQYEDIIGKLTGSEILSIDWMLEDSDS